MGESHLQFDDRVRGIQRKHQKLSGGVIHSVNHDGLIIARPRRPRIQLPIKGLFLMVSSFFLFKAFLLGYLGSITYLERVEKLSLGTLVEQAGAALMKPDPISIWLLDTFRLFF
ncbi:MAG: hypothetical protein AAFQ32_16385 [Pseudomonadota bacterium]